MKNYKEFLDDPLEDNIKQVDLSDFHYNATLSDSRPTLNTTQKVRAEKHNSKVSLEISGLQLGHSRNSAFESSFRANQYLSPT